MTDAEREEFIVAIAQAVSERSKPASLTDDEQRWVRMAIRKEAQSIAFRQAVIEKSLGGVAWTIMLFIGYMAMEFLRFKGFKQ